MIYVGKYVHRSSKPNPGWLCSRYGAAVCSAAAFCRRCKRKIVLFEQNLHRQRIYSKAGKSNDIILPYHGTFQCEINVCTAHIRTTNQKPYGKF